MNFKEILLIRKVPGAEKFSGAREKYIIDIFIKERKLLASYNSLLLMLLPEISQGASAEKKLYTYKITDSLLLLGLRIGEINADWNLEYSLDPHAFVPKQILS